MNVEAKYIAVRRLKYSEKGSDQKNNFSIHVSEPFIVSQSMVDFYIEGEVYACKVKIENLDESYPLVFGADGIQSLNLASNLEPFIERLQKKYNIYWHSGEPYFED